MLVVYTLVSQRQQSKLRIALLMNQANGLLRASTTVLPHLAHPDSINALWDVPYWFFSRVGPTCCDGAW